MHWMVDVATGLRVWAGGCGGGRRRGGARVEGWRVFGGPEWRGRFSLKCFDDYHVYYKSPSHDIPIVYSQFFAKCWAAIDTSYPPEAMAGVASVLCNLHNV